MYKPARPSINFFGVRMKIKINKIKIIKFKPQKTHLPKIEAVYNKL